MAVVPGQTDTSQYSPAALYNTPLEPDEAENFKGWANQQSQLVGRNVMDDLHDYDLQGWWKDNPDTDLSGAHLVDTYKKPNHPTFSDQSQYHGVNGNSGGTWEQHDDRTWTFAPGKTNYDNHPVNRLQDYFSRVEPGNKLDVSNYPLEPGYIPQWMSQKIR